MKSNPSVPDFLTVGTTKFARTPALLTASLFEGGGTANGTFKVRKDGVLFLNAKGEPFAFLVANRHGERFFVSCSKREGGIFYMFGLADSDASLLGISSLGYKARGDEAIRVWDLVSVPASPSPAAPTLTKNQALKKYDKATRLRWRSPLSEWRAAFPTVESLAEFRRDVGNISWPENFGQSCWDDAFSLAYNLGEGISESSRKYMLENAETVTGAQVLAVYAEYGLTVAAPCPSASHLPLVPPSGVTGYAWEKHFGMPEAHKEAAPPVSPSLPAESPTVRLLSKMESVLSRGEDEIIRLKADVERLTGALQACIPVLTEYSNSGFMPTKFLNKSDYCEALRIALLSLAEVGK